jgi:exonuclease I
MANVNIATEISDNQAQHVIGVHCKTADRYGNTHTVSRVIPLSQYTQDRAPNALIAAAVAANVRDLLEADDRG